MAKQDDESSALATSTPRTTAIIPSFLQGRDLSQDTSLAGMNEYYVLSRLKVVQGTAAKEIKDKFSEGSVILWPGSKTVVTKEVNFPFSPLFFWTEFMLFSDLEDKESQTILARTFDKSSDLAKRSKDKNLRMRGYGGHGKKRVLDTDATGHKYLERAVETLNFAGYVADSTSELFKAPVTLSFSRGEFMQGRNFLTAVQLRRIPLWAQVWNFKTAFRDKGPQQKWWGIDFGTIEDRPHIDHELAEFNEQQFNQLKEAYEQKRLQVDMSDKDAGADGTNAEAARAVAVNNDEM